MKVVKEKKYHKEAQMLQPDKIFVPQFLARFCF